MSAATDQYIKDIIDKQDFINYDIEEVPINTNGGNYLGELCEVSIKGETKNGAKRLNLFVKTRIGKEIPILSVKDAFCKEAFFYNELMVKYEELQDRAKVPIDERFKTPASYGNNDNEKIILQNLTKEGFTTGYRMDCASLGYAQNAIKQLAKFHGLSFVLKEREAKYFEDVIKPMKYVHAFDDKSSRFYYSVVKKALKHFKTEEKDKIEELLPKFTDKYRYYTRDPESTVFCVCHGDYRINNIMHRDTNGILELIPVDYQFLHYGCPVIDFLYFISLSTDKEFRKKHLEDLKNLYYDTLRNFLKYFDIDAESVYPRKEYERVYKERYDFMLIGVIFYGSFIFASEDDLPDVSAEEPDMKIKEEGIQRMKEMYEDVVEKGYLC